MFQTSQSPEPSDREDGEPVATADENDGDELHEKLMRVFEQCGIEVLDHRPLSPGEWPPIDMPSSTDRPAPPDVKAPERISPERYSLLVSWCPDCETWYWAGLE